MAVISYIDERDVDKYNNLVEVSKLDSAEDVSTLIDTFIDVKEKAGYSRIKYVVSDDEGYYYFVLSEKNENFDLFEFINRVCSSDIKVSCINARLLFPRELSRGIYDDSDDSDEEQSTSEQDTPTDYLDEGDLPQVKKGALYLYRVRGRARVSIPEGGMVVGRSSKKVDYLVQDNGNVGRVHCKIYLKDKRLYVHDYESLNGTFVNNRRVHSDKDVELVKGDILLLADEEFRVML